MRICLVARNRFHNDRRALVVHRALRRAGHEVHVVAVGRDAPRDPVIATVSQRMGPPNRLGAAANRVLPTSATDWAFRRRMIAACTAVTPDLVIPLHDDVVDVAVEAARRAGAVVQGAPGMAVPDDVDLVFTAPTHPDWAAPVAGFGSAFTPADHREFHQPETGRLQGESAVLCYRKTASNPGRYIESALVRAGMHVRIETEGIDLGTVDPTTRFVLFVESPYPALEVRGSTQAPILFWVHHGEHHLHANLRLANRYSADAVLLAHSWHLAHWFPVPGHRFPFAVPPELLDPSRPLADRSVAVALVGSKLRSNAWQYRRRQQLVASIESALGTDRTRFVEGVAPEEMAALYGDSRIVLNDGGARHFPITMRVLEAIGSGAVLLTDPAPGLELLFEPGHDLVYFTEDPVADATRILDDLDAAQAMVDGAVERAFGMHTYDHRVDDLVAIADSTRKRVPAAATAMTDLGRVIDADVEVQRIVHDEAHELVDQLPDREVWALSERTGRLKPAGMDAAIITQGSAMGKDDLLGAARRYIYATREVSDLDEYLATHHPASVSRDHASVRRVDLMTEAYRARTAEGSSL